MHTMLTNVGSSLGRIRWWIIAALALVILWATVPSCNTTEGVGKDVKSLGKGIEETAHDAKN